MSITRPFLHDLPAEWVSPRLVLRRWRDADAQPLYDAIMESQERLRQWMAWADTYQSVDDAVEFVRRQSGHWALHDHIGMGIFRKADGIPLGSVGLHVHDLTVPAIELGYWIRTGAEGHGYVSEAVRRMTAFAFTEFGAQRLVIRCDAQCSQQGCRRTARFYLRGLPPARFSRHRWRDPRYARLRDDPR